MKTESCSRPEIIDVGNCSLHIVNNAYKTSLKKTGREIQTFLKSLYQVFKNQPARRDCIPV